MARPRKYPPELLERGARLVVRVRPSDRACRALISGCRRRRCASTCVRSRPTRACGRICRRSEEREEIKRLRQEVFELRRANEILKAASRVFRDRARRRPSEVSAFIDEHRGRFGVEPICRTLGVSASAYYQRAQRRSARRGRSRTSGCSGGSGELHARQLLRLRLPADVEGAAARRRAGRRADRVERLMRSQRHPGRQAPRQAVAHDDARPGGAPAARPRRARLHAPRGPIELWVADFTYLRCWEGVVFFAFVIDVYCRRSSAGSSPRTCAPTSSSTRCGWRSTRARRGADVELVHHCDAGSQYTSLRLHPDPRRPRRARLDRLGRRRLRQRARRELRRQLQDRADRRPRLAHPHPARARDRRIRRLVQPRRACTRRSATSRPPSSKPSTLPGPFKLPLSINEKRNPPNPVSAKPSPAQCTAGRALRFSQVPATRRGDRDMSTARHPQPARGP